MLSDNTLEAAASSKFVFISVTKSQRCHDNIDIKILDCPSWNKKMSYYRKAYHHWQSILFNSMHDIVALVSWHNCQCHALCQSMSEPSRDRIPTYQQVIPGLKLASILLLIILPHKCRDIQLYFMRSDGHSQKVVSVEKGPGKYCINSRTVKISI